MFGAIKNFLKREKDEPLSMESQYKITSKYIEDHLNNPHNNPDFGSWYIFPMKNFTQKMISDVSEYLKSKGYRCMANERLMDIHGRILNDDDDQTQGKMVKVLLIKKKNV